MKNANILRTIVFITGLLIIFASFQVRKYATRMEVLESQYREFQLMRDKIEKTGVFDKKSGR